MINILGPILAEAGTSILADIVRKKSPAAAVVVEKIGQALGTAATPEAIEDRYQAQPAETIEAIRKVESEDPAYWQYLAGAAASQAALLKREDERESFFSWGWRPALSWLLIVLVAWEWLLLPIVNGAFGGGIAPSGQIIAFAGIWLTIYGGGHTLKSVVADMTAGRKA